MRLKIAFFCFFSMGCVALANTDAKPHLPISTAKSTVKKPADQAQASAQIETETKATENNENSGKKDEQKPENADPYAADSFNLPPGFAAASGLGEENNTTAMDTTEESKGLEKYNRNTTRMNDKLDKYIAKPVATFYNKVMPKPLNKMIDNFFGNIRMIPTVINDVLQGNFYQASSDSWRLAVNTTVGIGGLYDPAQDMGLEENYEDFGLTMAKWGWDDSAYFVLPIFGPDTIRGAIGDVITYQYMSVYPYIRPFSARLAFYTWHLLNERAQLLKYQTLMDTAAIDQYVFIRDAYLQRQAYLVRRNTELDNPNTIEQTRAYHSPYYLYN